MKAYSVSFSSVEAGGPLYEGVLRELKAVMDELEAQREACMVADIQGLPHSCAFCTPQDE